MAKGISNVFNHMYTQIMKEHLSFLSAGSQRNRNESFLRSQLSNPTILELIDTKALILDKLLKRLKSDTMRSALSYIQALLNDFLVAYVIFAIVLTAGTIAIAWWSLSVIKGNMWDTNIILKILPYETLSREEREEVKVFFIA
jgi:hypothetical protein